MSAKTSPKDLELIPERWKVISHIVDRTPKNQVSIVVKVRVSKLMFDLQTAMVLEGPNSERTLQDFADRLNASGQVLVEHVKAFADLPEQTRRNAMVKKASSLTGPGFDEPENKPPKEKQPVR